MMCSILRRVTLIWWVVGFVFVFGSEEEFGAANDSSMTLFDLSLEQLLKLPIRSQATLYPTTDRLVPAAVTRIGDQQIWRSGARNLDELLDAYVPGFQYMGKIQGPVMGIRGVISDRNNKMLLLVNGRVMNGHTSDTGAFSERHFSMLGDLQSVDVVRGPGSTVYGPGAIAGIINLTTYNGLTFQGFDAQVKQGFVEDFTSFETRYGKKLGNDAGVFFYYGVDDYRGSDQEDSPMYFSGDFVTADGVSVESGVAVPFEIDNDSAASRGKLHHKLHAQFTNENFDVWVRYTQGSQANNGVQERFESFGSDVQIDTVAGYQQFTLFADHTVEHSETFSTSLQASYDIFDFEFALPGEAEVDGSNIFNWREDEFYLRGMGYWEPYEGHRAAFGFEYSRELFGKDGLGYPNAEALITTAQPSLERWQTDRFSIVSEYQWEISPEWHSIISARVDDHTYTDWLFSPTASLVFAPTEEDTYKIVYNRSGRRADDADLRLEHLATGSREGEFEQIDTFELRYERQQSDRFWYALSGYHSQFDVVAFTYDTFESTELGNLEFYGLELEATYQTDQSRLSFSHNYTKHIDFDLSDPATLRQNISASPYGYGSDLANWSNHVTKLTVDRDIGYQWSVSGALNVYWGYPGGEDLAAYNADVLGNDNRLPINDGNSNAYDSSIFVNLGAEYRPSDRLRFRVDFHNVLGWADKDYNKRNEFQRTGQYRSDAAAITLSAGVGL